MPSPNVVGDVWSPVFRALKELRAAWPTRGWSWDGRLSCVSSSFSIEFETKARAAVALALPNQWLHGMLGSGPSAVRDVAERAGGLRPGQSIHSSNPVGSAFAYGLWWPWGDAMTASMRIGLGGYDATQEAFQRLRDTFGVEL